MKVHIVVPWARRRRLIRPVPRMVEYLSGHFGWTVAHEPNLAADVNYICSYTERWKEDGHPWDRWEKWDGPLACYFTHREPHGIKARMWNRAAEVVDLRLSQSLRNVPVLEKYGPTERITIPIDQEHFGIAEWTKNAKATIGTSGYCALTGRKGQALLYQLSLYPDTRHWDLKAAGRGWPVRTKEYHHTVLPRFYQSLDAYLCTSLFEGGPLGPFEALSCGIPVVIPRDVGALDELPDVPGVYRYTAGNFDEMVDALTLCLGQTQDKQSLRNLTKDMTIQAFCEDHRRAFEKHFGGDEDVAIQGGDVPGGEAKRLQEQLRRGD